MRRLDVPAVPIGTAYRTCVAGVRDPAARGTLEGLATSVDRVEAQYSEHGLRGMLWSLQPMSLSPTVNKKGLVDLYDRQMFRKRPPKGLVRPATYGTAERRLSALWPSASDDTDHYLPKSKFPEMAVLPANLVPSCAECNREKWTKHPATASEQFFYPYYEDWNGARWLAAAVKQGTAPALVFLVQSPPAWPPELNARVQHHFEELGYGSQAAEELVGVRWQLEMVHRRGGALGLQDHLLECAQSRAQAHLNSWAAAAYEALANSVWFCSVGFSLIPKP